MYRVLLADEMAGLFDQPNQLADIARPFVQDRIRTARLLEGEP